MGKRRADAAGDGADSGFPAIWTENIDEVNGAQSPWPHRVQEEAAWGGRRSGQTIILSASAARLGLYCGAAAGVQWRAAEQCPAPHARTAERMAGQRWCLASNALRCSRSGHCTSHRAMMMASTFQPPHGGRVSMAISCPRGIPCLGTVDAETRRACDPRFAMLVSDKSVPDPVPDVDNEGARDGLAE
jgi:hypothetical protein